MKPLVIGMDIGGTKVMGWLTDGTIWGTNIVTCETPAASRPGALAGLTKSEAAYDAALLTGRTALLELVTELCRTLIENAGEGVVKAIGIGSAGQIDTERGVVIEANDNLVGWKGTPLAAQLEAALGLPVSVENDVRAMAWAEVHYGAGRGLENVLCLTVGTGIGGALVQGGHLWHGAHFTAGEIGYLYAGDGHTLESRCSGTAIARRYAEQERLETPLPVPQIYARATDGDATCREAIATPARELGEILAPLFAFLGVQAVVVGGGIPEMGALWWQPFVEGVRAHLPTRLHDSPVLPAALGTRAGMIGAGLIAAQKAGLL